MLNKKFYDQLKRVFYKKSPTKTVKNNDPIYNSSKTILKRNQDHKLIK